MVFVARRVWPAATLAALVVSPAASTAAQAPSPAPGTFWQGVPVIRAARTGTAQQPETGRLAAAFWARPQVRWAVSNGWVTKAGPNNFGPSTLIHRLGAAKVLALAYQQRTGTAVWPDPYREAVT
ncbi:MAG TPA: hypothetical protein VGG23_05035, partial [Acidimicrobiales bacterium]